MHNEVDGKKVGWYNYEGQAAENMEKYWKQLQTNAGLEVRIVHTDYIRGELRRHGAEEHQVWDAAGRSPRGPRREAGARGAVEDSRQGRTRGGPSRGGPERGRGSDAADGSEDEEDEEEEEDGSMTQATKKRAEA
ncbi:unnamed protein product [Prorocentrum cordatum]|uniref:Uncharacterized protein n=1 Tax=Prorocentrum cordatum TaxID=2364126 RepID=A0ABN9T3Y8_9DINO|nr:unnamed protein product [Polarella glacialis]